jgi:hypothetical protein
MIVTFAISGITGLPNVRDHLHKDFDAENRDCRWGQMHDDVWRVSNVSQRGR